MLAPIVSHGQNWQTVCMGDTVYFTAGANASYKGHYYYPPQKPPMIDSPMLRVMFIVDAAQSGADSLFRFYTSLRDTFQFRSGADTCIDTLASSWLGPAFIRKSDGTEYYFNSRRDTIAIRTLDGLGSSWLLARDTGGRRFVGTVAQAGLMMVDGVTDSFKTISVQAYSGNTPISHYFNSKLLQLSKNHGWLQTLDFCLFPNSIRGGRTGIALDGTQHIRLPAAFREGRITQNIAWKYSPGNEWIWKYERGFSGPDRRPAFTVVQHDSVVAFQAIGTGAGLATIRRIEHRSYHHFVLNLPPPVYQGYVDSSSTSVAIHIDTVRDILSSPVSTQMENGWRSSMSSRYYVWPYDSVRFFITRANLAYYGLQFQRGCMRLLQAIGAPDDHNSFETYLPDFGLTGDYTMNVYGPSHFQEEYGRYIFIKTGTDSFGARVNVAKLDVPATMPMGSFTVMPNPANDLLAISAATGSGPVSLTLRNMLGQIIIQQQIQGHKLSLSTSHIPSGLYLLEMAGKNHRQTIKVLIQH